VERTVVLGELTLRPSKAEEAGERLGRLFDAHHQRLFRLARRLSSDAEEARDLVQETFLRAARRPAAVPEGDSSGEAWLVRVLVNLCRDRFRRLSVRHESRSALAAPSTAQDPAEAAVARASVAGALARLPARRRAVVVLAELEELPTVEVARLLGMAKVTVRWHLAAGRKQLAAILRPLLKAPGARIEEVEP
jgi:RNA polymerase sigma-70 factor (ECF subfamily)